MSGFTHSFGSGDADIWLIRTDAAGDTVWTLSYGGAGFEWGRSVQQISDGGFVVAGYTESFGFVGGAAWLIRTHAAGDTVWTRTYPGAFVANSARQTADGGFIFLATTESAGRDVWLIRTDALGNMLWTQTYGGSGYEKGYSIEQTADGGFIIAAVTTSFGAGDGDAWLIRIAPE